MMLSVAFAFILSEEVHLRGVDTFSGIGNMYHVTHCWHGLLGQSVPRSNYLCVIVYMSLVIKKLRQITAVSETWREQKHDKYLVIHLTRRGKMSYTKCFKVIISYSGVCKTCEVVDTKIHFRNDNYFKTSWNCMTRYLSFLSYVNSRLMRSVESEMGRQYGGERSVVMLKADDYRTVSFSPGWRRRKVGSRLTREKQRALWVGCATLVLGSAFDRLTCHHIILILGGKCRDRLEFLLPIFKQCVYLPTDKQRLCRRFENCHFDTIQRPTTVSSF